MKVWNIRDNNLKLGKKFLGIFSEERAQLSNLKDKDRSEGARVRINYPLFKWNCNPIFKIMNS